MADPTSPSGTTTAPSGGGLSTETIVIIVGCIAGGLFLLVLVLVCAIGCYLHRNSEKSDDVKDKKDKKVKKKKEDFEYRDRIFRPVDWGDPAGPEGTHDIAEIDHILWQEAQSRRGSIAMRNPAFKDDNEDEKAVSRKVSNGHAVPVSAVNGDGPPRPPNLDMLPPVARRQSSKSEASSKPHTPSGPRTPTSPTQKLSILDSTTWGAPDITADIDPEVDVDPRGPNTDRSRAWSGSQPNTVSAAHNDPSVDFSVFGAGNMRGAALQDNTLRRSFRSRSQAIVDFYESGYSNSMGARSAASLPMSRMDHEIEADDEPTSGYGTGSRMLWQKRRFVT